MYHTGLHALDGRADVNLNAIQRRSGQRLSLRRDGSQTTRRRRAAISRRRSAGAESFQSLEAKVAAPEVPAKIVNGNVAAKAGYAERRAGGQGQGAAYLPKLGPEALRTRWQALQWPSALCKNVRALPRCPRSRLWCRFLERDLC